MYLKILGKENMSDSNSSKAHQIFECKTVEFYRTRNADGVPSGDEVENSNDNPPDTAWALIDGERRVQLTGNAYVMSDRGTTITSFAFSWCPDPLREERKRR